MKYLSPPFHVFSVRLIAVLIAAMLCLGSAVNIAAQDDVDDEEAPPPLNGDAKLTMNFRDVQVQSILDYLSEQAGLIVVNRYELEERITVINRQPVMLDEALGLLNAMLREQGYTTIRRGRLLRVVPLNDAKRMSVPVRMGADPAKIGDTDTIITQIIPLRYVKAEALAENIAPLVSAEFAELTANESSNSLIVTNTESNIRRIAEIAQALDQSISQVREVRVFRLTFADADDVVSVINNIFKVPTVNVQQDVDRAIRRRFRRGGDRDDDDEEAAAGSGLEVTAASDERTNSVVVGAEPTVMEAVARMITDLDNDTAAKESVMIYRAKNTTATDLEALFNALFNGATIDRSSDTTLRNGRGGITTNFVLQDGNNQNTGRGNTGRGNQNAEAGSASDLVNNVIAVADETTNSLLVLTPEVNFPRIEAILDELDRPVPQVLVRVLVAELTHEKGRDIGTEMSLRSEPGANTVLQTITNFGAPANGLSLAVLATDYSATLTALETVGVLDVLSRPYILTRDNQEAEILVGEEVPFVTNSRVTDDGNTINTIEYREIGIILGVTPQINDEGLVVLNVSQELSSLLQSTVQISQGFAAQRIAKRTADTRIGVMTGQTVVIGGLMQESATENISKVPLLGDIPLLGALFSRTQTNVAKTELLLFLTPEVIMEPGDLTAMTERVRQQSRDLNDTVAPGALKRHLEQMRGASPLPPIELDEVEPESEDD